MKLFIYIGLGLLGIAILVTVGLFYVVHTYTPSIDEVSQFKQEALNQAKATLEGTLEEVSPIIATSTETLIAEGGVALKSFSLTEGQLQALEAVGINPETFVVTQGMLACAEKALGADRVAVILSGQVPNLLEMTQLTPCLTGS